MQYFVLREQSDGQFALTKGVLSGTAEYVMEACAALTAEHNERHAVWPYNPATRAAPAAPAAPVETTPSTSTSTEA